MKKEGGESGKDEKLNGRRRELLGNWKPDCVGEGRYLRRWTFVVPNTRKPGNQLWSGKGRGGTVRTLIQIFRLTGAEYFVHDHDRDSFRVLILA